MASRKFNARKYHIRKLRRRDELSSKRPKVQSVEPIAIAPVEKSAPKKRVTKKSTK